jgi:DNA gyrase inhibitor GyrI
MADDITRKHLDRARVRGAPSAIPGAAGLVHSYPFEEVNRQTARALVAPLEKGFHLEALKAAQEKLAQLAAQQDLFVVEQPLVALKADPMEAPPGSWEWEVLLPIRGRAKADEAAGVTVGRIHGGSYVETMTHGGFPDLPNLYTFFLGRLLPSRKQQLTRPVIYHRTLGLLESANAERLHVAVFLPIQLSLKPPTRLVTREEMT